MGLAPPSGPRQDVDVLRTDHRVLGQQDEAATVRGRRNRPGSDIEFIGERSPWHSMKPVQIRRGRTPCGCNPPHDNFGMRIESMLKVVNRPLTTNRSIFQADCERARRDLNHSLGCCTCSTTSLRITTIGYWSQRNLKTASPFFRWTAAWPALDIIFAVRNDKPNGY